MPVVQFNQQDFNFDNNEAFVLASLIKQIHATGSSAVIKDLMERFDALLHVSSNHQNFNTKLKFVFLKISADKLPTVEGIDEICNTILTNDAAVASIINPLFTSLKAKNNNTSFATCFGELSFKALGNFKQQFNAGANHNNAAYTTLRNFLTVSVAAIKARLQAEKAAKEAADKAEAEAKAAKEAAEKAEAEAKAAAAAALAAAEALEATTAAAVVTAQQAVDAAIEAAKQAKIKVIHANSVAIFAEAKAAALEVTANHDKEMAATANDMAVEAKTNFEALGEDATAQVRHVKLTAAVKTKKEADKLKAIAALSKAAFDAAQLAATTFRQTATDLATTATQLKDAIVPLQQALETAQQAADAAHQAAEDLRHPEASATAKAAKAAAEQAAAEAAEKAAKEAAAEKVRQEQAAEAEKAKAEFEARKAKLNGSAEAVAVQERVVKEITVSLKATLMGKKVGSKQFKMG